MRRGSFIFKFLVLIGRLLPQRNFATDLQTDKLKLHPRISLSLSLSLSLANPRNEINKSANSRVTRRNSFSSASKWKACEGSPGRETTIKRSTIVASCYVLRIFPARTKGEGGFWSQRTYLISCWFHARFGSHAPASWSSISASSPPVSSCIRSCSSRFPSTSAGTTTLDWRCSSNSLVDGNRHGLDDRIPPPMTEPWFPWKFVDNGDRSWSFRLDYRVSFAVGVKIVVHNGGRLTTSIRIVVDGWNARVCNNEASILPRVDSTARSEILVHVSYHDVFNNSETEW